jgi:polysaccharide export outer membrane protein
MTLLESLTRAGGILPTADQSYIMVTRDGVSYPINIPLLVRQGINPSSIMLMNGDVVRVRSRDENKVYVLGEVQTAKALAMNNGRMTLTEALGEAGGLNQLSASSKQVYVVRNADQAEPVVYNLDAGSPVALALAENFELNPRDVVFVDASGLARFSRVVSLLIPTAAATTAGYGQIK